MTRPASDTSLKRALTWSSNIVGGVMSPWYDTNASDFAHSAARHNRLAQQPALLPDLGHEAALLTVPGGHLFKVCRPPIAMVRADEGPLQPGHQISGALGGPA